MSTPSQDPDWSGRRGAGRGPGWDGARWQRPDRHGRGWPAGWQQLGWSGEPEVNRRDRVQRRGDAGKPVRIGDAERDEAVSRLSDHFVAGRITQAEFEERSEAASRARYVGDLVPLFDDLPQEMQAPVPVRRGPHRPPPFMMLMPFLMVGLVISSIALAAPWMLWGLFWVAMISGISRRRWGYYRR
jgi:hypothetical protein